MPNKPTPGGKRSNAGRKPTGRKVHFNSVQFSESVIEMIDEIKNHHGVKSRPSAVVPLIKKEYKKLKKDEKST